MKLHIKIKHVLLAMMTCVVGASCQKDSPYRQYTNEVKEFEGNMVQYLESQPNTFSSLLLVLDRLPDLKDQLTENEVTLFAPTNINFNAALNELNQERKDQDSEATLLDLNTVDLTELEIMMDKYIIPGQNLTDSYKSFTDGVYASSIKFNYQMHIQYQKQDASGYLSGGPVTLYYSDPNNSTVKVYWQRTNTNAVNIKATNGIIHIIEPNHIFGFGRFTEKMNK